MWKIRWKLMGSFAAVLALTSAHLLAADNFVIMGPEDTTFEHDDHNDTLANHENHDNILYNETNPVTDNKTASANFAEIKKVDSGIIVVVPDLSDVTSVSTRNSKETSETSSLERSHKSSESNSVSVSKDTSKSSNESLEILQSFENGSEQMRSSEEINEPTESIELETSDSDINEPESNENASSGEAASAEPPTSIESPPVSMSSESGSDSAAEEIIGAEHVIQTTHGPVKGYHWPGNTEIIAFYDIPYGKFDRPFETPVTAQSWLDLHEATEHTSICPQLNNNNERIGNNKCLTLSIFTPKDSHNASVLFHVHDAYAKNCTSADPLIYGPDYLVPKGVILVLPNYRIGPLGFLCLRNETALGNAGLKDLTLALEWVKDNILSFGGNPSNIIASGNGASGAYAGLLAIFTRSKYYIDKVITESGSALSHWALDRNPMNTAHELAENIRTEHSEGVIFNDTFAEVSLETLLKAAKGISFRPCIEHDKEPFMDDTPWRILQSKEIDATFMIGSANYAGAQEATDTAAEFVTQINEHFDLLLPKDLVFKNDDERNKYSLKLKKQYFGEDNITATDIEELSLWCTDASYLSPVIRLARNLLSAGAAVYLYEFAFVGSLNQELEALHKPVPGAVRGDLTGYLFRRDATSVVEDSPEKRMIELMVDIWISFINTGKPAAANFEWNELEKAVEEDEEWLLINSEPKIKKGIHVDRLRLWTSLYDKHFIENSSAAKHGSLYLALAAALMCLITNNKLNYNSQ